MTKYGTRAFSRVSESARMNPPGDCLAARETAFREMAEEMCK